MKNCILSLTTKTFKFKLKFNLLNEKKILYIFMVIKVNQQRKQYRTKFFLIHHSKKIKFTVIKLDKSERTVEITLGVENKKIYVQKYEQLDAF